MGTYHVSCSLTNISIKKGQKVQLFPLKDNRKKLNDGVLPSRLIYPVSHFKFFTFPIVGEYDGYGSIKNIVKNQHIKSIEKYFGFSIEEFVKIVCCPRSENDSLGALSKHFKNKSLNKEKSYQLSILKGLTGTFVLDEIYQEFIANKVNYQSIDNESFINSFNTTINSGITSMNELRDKCHHVEAVLYEYFDVSVRKTLDFKTSIFVNDLILTKELINFMYKTNRYVYPSFAGLQYDNKSKKRIKLQELKLEALQTLQSEKEND